MRTNLNRFRGFIGERNKGIPGRRARGAFLTSSILSAGCIMAGLSCSTDPTEPDLSSRTIEAGDFTFVVRGGVTDEDVTLLLDALTGNTPRILAHLQVPSMPHITVRLWAANLSRDWFSTMASSLGTVYQGATGYLWGGEEMRLLWNSESPTEVVHEFAHLVSMQVNPTISNNPRWLWEAIATYEAGQLYHPGSWQPGALSFPGLSALNQFNSPLPYRWGYLISEAVIERWGDEGYLALLAANGRVQETLGISESEFGTYLEEFVRGYR